MESESRRLISTFNIQHPVYKGDIGMMIKREIIDIKFMYLETGVVENKRDRERERERDGKKCRWEYIEKRLIGRQNHVK